MILSFPVVNLLARNFTQVADFSRLPLDLWGALSPQEQRLLPVSVYQRNSAQHHFSFHQLLPHNCKHSFTSFPQPWSPAQTTWELKYYWYVHAPVTSQVVFLEQWRRSPRGFPWATGLALTRVTGWGKPHKPILSRDNSDNCLVILFVLGFFGTLLSCLHNPRGFWHKQQK